MKKIVAIAKQYRKTTLTVIFVSYALLFVMPFFITKGGIWGADFAFHYNRFYDAAMQIKHGNFQPYISMYGFQQSGRIVNALYGPAFAYFQGILVLLAGTWYRYQILSNFLLVLLASVSMYFLARTTKVCTVIALLLGMLFPFTYTIGYWVFEQGFSSWGAALFPLCFIPAVKFYQTCRLNVFYLGMAVAMMFQVHVLSTAFLILSYIPLFLVGFIKSEDKWKVLVQVAASVAIFLVLSVNVWYPLFNIRTHNSLQMPFINKELDTSTITDLKWWMIVRPVFMLPLIAVQLILFTIMIWKQTEETKIIFGTYFVYLFLATGIFPWKRFMENSLVQTMQFPFRFYFYAVVLLLLLLGMQESQISSLRLRTMFSFMLVVAVSIAFLQNTYHIVRESAVNQQNKVISELRNMEYSADIDTVRESLYSKDMLKLLQIAEKPTSDYVLDYQGERRVKDLKEDQVGSYHRYQLQIMKNNRTVSKQVKGDRLVVTWKGQENEQRVVPVIIYADSQVELNGQVLSPSQFQITRSGALVVQQKKGKNQVVLWYPHRKSYAVMSILVALIWGVTMVLSVLKNRGFVHAQMES